MTEKMTGAQAMVKCLEKEGVSVVFGYPGVAICPFFNSIYDSEIERVLVRTEQNAGHAASGYARVTGEVGVCVATSGPGATNLITGIATAYADSIPMVAITGQVSSELIGRDVFQEADITGAVESFVKYSYLVKDVKDIPRVFKEAFYIASTGRKGPVLIDMPIDIQNQMLDFEYPKEVSLRTYKPTVKGHAVQIKKVIEALKTAKQPVICVGGGVLLSGAEEEVQKFSAAHSIPVVNTMMGMGVMPSDHPMYFGMVGNNGKAYANLAMNNSDLLIMMGARVADRAISQPELVTENTVVVHIDVDPAEIGKNMGPSIPIVGDIKHILQDFQKHEFQGDYGQWITQLQTWKQEKAVKRNPKAGYVDPAEFVRLLSENMEEDPAFYTKFSVLIQNVIDAYRQKQISDLEYLKRITEAKKRLDAREHDEVPENLAHNDNAIAAYGVIHPIISELDLSEDKVKEISSIIAFSFDKILEANNKVNFWNDEDAINNVKDMMDDYFYDVIRDEKGISIPSNIMDQIIEKVLFVERKRRNQ